MNEYNERTLKNVLEDLREEDDAEFLKEMEEAANDPLFQIKEGEAQEFAEKFAGKKKNKSTKLYIRAASILVVLVIAATVIPINVEGTKSTLAQLIVNYVNSEFIAVDSNDKLLEFEGQYVPGWIPNGYEVDSIANEKDRKTIQFVNADRKKIIYTEQTSDLKSKIDSENFGTTQEIEINDFHGIYAEKDGVRRIVLKTNDSIIYITCNDSNVDLIGFAELIEKR